MTRLTCAFGTKWPCGPCKKCLAYSAMLSAQFNRGVFFGLHDDRGYKPGEKKGER